MESEIAAGSRGVVVGGGFVVVGGGVVGGVVVGGFGAGVSFTGLLDIAKVVLVKSVVTRKTIRMLVLFVCVFMPPRSEQGLRT